ncbi:MAG TPA: glutathionylspermidine synthase family protein [Verrucomicrobiae bacterium]|nr:glutathionylspermidine synthase family protein [Verrucomicrobiae bacterium]
MTAGLAVPQNTEPARLFTRSPGIRAGSALDSETALDLRRRAALEGCKWDSQVGDVTTLAPFPLVMKRSVWDHLSARAEQLTAEAAEAEQEISGRPDLLRQLGLPRRLQAVLADEAPLSPAAGRIIRFDFHLTTEGWRVSEANSDVPGGFSEASHFTAIMAEHFPGLEPAGNPGHQWCDALLGLIGSGGVVALLSAPGYMEDHQVVSFLATELRRRGCQAHLAKPEQIRWREGHAYLDTLWYRGPLDAVVRFYQAEWICRLPESACWQQFFRGGKTPVANPALATITESKRFPLLWDKLSVDLPTWRALLPETRDPRQVAWSGDDGWLVKTAMCNTGDTVSIRQLMPAKQWLRTRFNVLLKPNQWVAQRRFESVPVPTPAGQRHVCIGVYTINGRTAGAYARVAEKPLIDFAAVDVALLVEQHD